MKKTHTLQKDHPTSFCLSHTSRRILQRGKMILDRTYTSIVEDAIHEWGLAHLTPEMVAQFQAMQHPFDFSSGVPDATTEK